MSKSIDSLGKIDQCRFADVHIPQSRRSTIANLRELPYYCDSSILTGLGKLEQMAPMRSIPGRDACEREKTFGGWRHIPRHNPLNLEAKYSRSYIETITFPRHAGQGDARDEYLGSSNAKRGQRLL